MNGQYPASIESSVLHCDTPASHPIKMILVISISFCCDKEKQLKHNVYWQYRDALAYLAQAFIVSEIYSLIQTESRTHDSS